VEFGVTGYKGFYINDNEEDYEEKDVNLFAITLSIICIAY